MAGAINEDKRHTGCWPDLWIAVRDKVRECLFAYLASPGSSSLLADAWIINRTKHWLLRHQRADWIGSFTLCLSKTYANAHCLAHRQAAHNSFVCLICPTGTLLNEPLRKERANWHFHCCKRWLPLLPLSTEIIHKTPYKSIYNCVFCFVLSVCCPVHHSRHDHSFIAFGRSMAVALWFGHFQSIAGRHLFFWSVRESLDHLILLVTLLFYLAMSIRAKWQPSPSLLWNSLQSIIQATTATFLSHKDTFRFCLLKKGNRERQHLLIVSWAENIDQLASNYNAAGHSEWSVQCLSSLMSPLSFSSSDRWQLELLLFFTTAIFLWMVKERCASLSKMSLS